MEELGSTSSRPLENHLQSAWEWMKPFRTTRDTKLLKSIWLYSTGLFLLIILTFMVILVKFIEIAITN